MSLQRTAMAWTHLMTRPGRATRPFGVLDLGSRKLCCCVARIDGEGRLQLLGAAHQAADGLVGGEIVDVAAAEAAIRSVVEEAEIAAEERLDDVAVVLAGGTPMSGYVRVEIALHGQPVRRTDVAAALEHAARHAPADGFAIVHAVPLGESLDGGPEVRDATGLVGKRLVVRAHVVGVRRRPLEQLAGCLARCHLRLATVLAAPYASALACLSRDEAERGALVVDCGARTTTLAILQQGRLQYVGAVPQGSDHLTDELAQRLAIPQPAAERLKNLEASVVWRACDSFETLELTPLGARGRDDTIEVPRRRLTEIVRPLTEALFGAVVEQLNAAPSELRTVARRSVVLTGGGALQDGMVEFAAERLGSARLGRPAVVTGWSEPQVAAVTGALALAGGFDGGIGYAPVPAASGAFARPLSSLTRWLRESLGVT